jgi:hypothetical protein
VYSELFDLYSSQNIIGVLKLRMLWAGHVASMGVRGRGEVHNWVFWGGNMREKDHLKHIGVDGRIILKWIFKMSDGEVWTGLIWLRIGTCGRLL